MNASYSNPQNQIARNFYRIAILAIMASLVSCGLPGESPSDVTLSWVKPTKNTDGSPLRDLRGYIIYFGDSPGALTHTIKLPDPASTRYVVRSLSSGPHYFSVAAYTASGALSPQCAPVLKVTP
jgi:hypothetical protein